MAGERLVLTFRDRLLVALLVIAIVPVALIAIYGRYSAQQRLQADTDRRLDDATTTLAMYMLEQINIDVGGIRSSFSQEMAEQIASDLGTDFNLYIGTGLRMTSRPELYEAGLLDRRLSGSAYAAIMVKGRRFYTEEESIGLYRYGVGYRALLDASGESWDRVHPTLYRQDQMEEETARRNAFLVAVYAVVLLAVVVIATTLANRIASPIHRLTEATAKVARGELDVALEATTADGEVGN